MRGTEKLLLAISLLATTIGGFAAPETLKFSSAEHVFLGDQVVLHFSAEDPATPAVPLTLPNGLVLSYGQLVALGDFYGTPDAPISQGKTVADQHKRFLAAFYSFANNPANVTEVQQILAVMEKEADYIRHGLERGLREEDLYDQTQMDLERQMNCITGGGCSSSNWWLYPGRYLDLAKSNWDHFGEDALLAYQTGHQLALKQALHASKTHSMAQLELAYALNAFACHFLSDRFSTGHMRTPRAQLPDHVTPRLIGHLLVNLMHNEENLYGLHVHNQTGQHWMAYGDRSMLGKPSAAHRRAIIKAMQRSADELFATYQHGKLPSKDSVLPLVPEPDELGSAAQQDISPLFYWDDSKQQLMRRKNLQNPYDRHWIARWWSWSTLVKLAAGNKLPVRDQAALAASDWRNEALDSGLITDPSLLAWLNGEAE